MTLILIARIVAAHGIRGAVKLKSFASDAKTITSHGALQTADGRALTVLRMKLAVDVFIADIQDVKDRNAAEALVGQDLFIARDKLPAPKDGEFYLHDLIGKTVVADAVSLGAVNTIENYGAGDLMELANGDLLPVAFIDSVTDVITVTRWRGVLWVRASGALMHTTFEASPLTATAPSMTIRQVEGSAWC
jgi:16S rRNA processing protein RimM